MPTSILSCSFSSPPLFLNLAPFFRVMTSYLEQRLIVRFDMGLTLNHFFSVVFSEGFSFFTSEGFSFFAITFGILTLIDSAINVFPSFLYSTDAHMPFFNLPSFFFKIWHYSKFAPTISGRPSHGSLFLIYSNGSVFLNRSLPLSREICAAGHRFRRRSSQ